jgi:histidyl-tRNA synthetase
MKELKNRDLSDESINQLKYLLNIGGTNQEKIKNLRKLFNLKNISLNGVDLLDELIDTSQKFNFSNININVDLSLARGLSYYTGTIIEVSSPKEFSIGSIGGGGRYDDLVQKNNPRLSGFGISFGFDRIFMILEELKLFPNELDSSKSFLFLNFGLELDSILSYVNQLREKNITCELYPANAKIKKQLDYANQKGIDYVIIIGDEEVKSNSFKLKEMKSGNQSSIDISNLLSEIESLN